MGQMRDWPADQKEKHRLAAVSAGGALTIAIWVAAISFMPGRWLDRLEQGPAWLYCTASTIVWAILSGAIYFIYRRLRGKLVPTRPTHSD